MTKLKPPTETHAQYSARIRHERFMKAYTDQLNAWFAKQIDEITFGALRSSPRGGEVNPLTSKETNENGQT